MRRLTLSSVAFLLVLACGDDGPSQGSSDESSTSGEVEVTSSGPPLTSSTTVEPTTADATTGVDSTTGPASVCGNGIIELAEECDGGAMCRSDCKFQRCGNGLPDPGEVCDDGNATPGDGCSFDCASNETCGNRIVDYFAGEQCDDANARHHDGCTPGCREEPLRWEERSPGPPSARHAATFSRWS